MRLFVAAWPSPAVRHRLQVLDRPTLDGVRWTPADRWHVTLRFLGEVDDPAPVVTAVTAACAALAPPVARLGEVVEPLGPVAVVPVGGLDALAAAVIAATAHMGQPPDDRPFRGHITIARTVGRRPLPAGLTGRPVGAAGEDGRQWSIDTVAVVRSGLGTAPHYEVVATIPLSAGR